MNKKQYAFVGPRKRINRLWETEQSADKIPQGVTQIKLTPEQLELVIAFRDNKKQAAWINNEVVEFVEP